MADGEQAARVRAAAAAHGDWIMAQPGVQAVHDTAECLTVWGQNLAEETKRNIERAVGVPVRFVEGIITKS